jgi:hypothetical protein
MHFLKRVELWVLLAVVIGGLAWVFMSGHREEEDLSAAGTTATADSQAPLRLHRCVLKRDHGNARLDIELRVRNDGAETLVMHPPKVKLVAAGGRVVPEFFLPFEPRPEVAPGASQDVQLRYWLEWSDLKGALTLEVDGKTLAIKGKEPFDLNSMENDVEKVLQPGSW